MACPTCCSSTDSVPGLKHTRVLLTTVLFRNSACSQTGVQHLDCLQGVSSSPMIIRFPSLEPFQFSNITFPEPAPVPGHSPPPVSRSQLCPQSKSDPPDVSGARALASSLWRRWSACTSSRTRPGPPAPRAPPGRDVGCAPLPYTQNDIDIHTPTLPELPLQYCRVIQMR